MEDLYEILGVPRDASQADIKKAYRQLVRKYHPDAHPGDKEAEEKFKKINAAYSVLENEEKRARYDQFGTAGNNMGGMGGMDLNDLFGDLFGSVFGGGFNAGFGGSSRRQSTDPNAPRRGSDLEMIVNLTLLEAAQGVNREIEVPRLDACKACGGSGAKAGTKPETCSQCHGTGRVRKVQQTFLGQMMTETTCPACNGSGKIIKDKCPDCKGQGRIKHTHKLEVKIPAGVNRGTRVCVRGEGEGGINGGTNGDLYLITDVENIYKNIERDGADLHTPLIITYPQAVLGGEAKVNTLIDGEENLTIPAGTKHGEILRLKGKGMPRLNNKTSRGDLYAHVFIDVPDKSKLSDKQKELITQLADEMDASVLNLNKPDEPGFFDKVKNLFK